MVQPNRLLFFFIGMSVLFSCQRVVESDQYGEKFELNSPLSPDECIHALETGKNRKEFTIDDNQTIQGMQAQVKGKITAMCKMSGCWFDLETAEGLTFHVTMKDHQATNPKWINQQVVVNGYAYVEKVSIEQQIAELKENDATEEEISGVNAEKKSYQLYALGVQASK